MKFNIGQGGEVKVLNVFKNAKKVKDAKELYDYLKEKELFKGNLGEIYSNISYTGDNVILVGLGEEDKVNLQALRTAYAKVGKEMMAYKIKSADIVIPKFENLDYKLILLPYFLWGCKL